MKYSCVFSGLLGLWVLASGSAHAEPPCIGLVTAGGGDKFWATLARGAVEAGTQYGYRVIPRGPKLEDNYEAQAEIIKYFETRGCAGLVLAANTAALAGDVKRVQQSGMVTLFVDRPLKSLPDVALITTDNFAGGKLAAKEMLARLKADETNIAVFRLKADVETTTLRENGFIESASLQGKTVVLDAYVGTYVPDIIENTLSLLKTLNKPLHGVFTPNEETTMAVVSALKYMKFKPVHIGFDQNAFIDKALQENALAGTIVQRPFEMGHASITAIHRYLSDGTPPQSAFLGVEFVTRDSLAQQPSAQEPIEK
jgi:ribose transport system substrate-binding protein